MLQYILIIVNLDSDIKVIPWKDESLVPAEECQKNHPVVLLFKKIRNIPLENKQRERFLTLLRLIINIAKLLTYKTIKLKLDKETKMKDQ